MTEPPRDWDKELAAIDRAIAKAPAGQPAAPAPIRVGGPPPPAVAGRPLPAAGRRERFATWVRVVVTGALAVALLLYPYAHACGLGLVGYLAAVGVTGLSGLWVAGSAWRRRQGLAHVLALCILLWALALGAAQVLPRIGYARQTAVWRCS